MDSMIFVGPFQLNYSTAKRMPKGTEDFFPLKALLFGVY